LCFAVVEIMGYCTWSNETAANESVHYVDGRQFHFDIPNHDGWNDVHQAYSSSFVYTAELVVLFQ
jgi:hypothetical protein